MPQNEPILEYRAASPERQKLESALLKISSDRPEIYPVINGKEVRDVAPSQTVSMPHRHGHKLANYSLATEDTIQKSIDGALRVRRDWAKTPWEDRLKIFEKAADLIAGPKRAEFNAATMHGQSKNCFQAEIDSACELVDFFRFNAHFYREILNEQPISTPQATNRLEYRGLEGFVTAITPFNFTAIAGNLPVSAAMAGNVVLWKPSNTQLLAAYHTYQILKECGLPDGVIQFLPSQGSKFGKVTLSDPNFAGLHFTGSTEVFQTLWAESSKNLTKYKTFPRLVGETGGKNFVFAHPSADPIALKTALVRGAYEYQGQKCSAASRAYIPRSLWNNLKDDLTQTIHSLSTGPVDDFKHLVNAVIDEASYDNMMRAFERAKSDSGTELCTGGSGDKSVGYFVRPTLYQVSNPKSFLMREEFFGPCLAVFVYDDSQSFEDLYKLIEETTDYGLTGAILAQDTKWLEEATLALNEAAGNFYINDKPTGAVVAQQPFGGARKSGTNDKAGSKVNLYRWLSPRVVKTTLQSPREIFYPSQM